MEQNELRRIHEALKSSVFKRKMVALGFELLPQNDKYRSDFFFYKDGLIVFYSQINFHVEIFERANRFDL